MTKTAPWWFDHENMCSTVSCATHQSGVDMLVFTPGHTTRYPRLTLWPEYYEEITDKGERIKRLIWNAECISLQGMSQHFITGSNVLLEVFLVTSNRHLNNECLARHYGVPKAFGGQFFAKSFGGGGWILANVPDTPHSDLSEWTPNGPSISIYAHPVLSEQVKQIVRKYPI